MHAQMIFVKRCKQLMQMPDQMFTEIVKDADTNMLKVKMFTGNDS